VVNYDGKGDEEQPLGPAKDEGRRRKLIGDEGGVEKSSGETSETFSRPFPDIRVSTAFDSLT